MGSKVDPTVSSGCCGASSQTRLDLTAFWKRYLSPWDGEIICSYKGRNNGIGCGGDNGITSLTDELCEPPSALVFLQNLNLLKTLETFR